jgi:hypothetical protein
MSVIELAVAIGGRPMARRVPGALLDEVLTGDGRMPEGGSSFLARSASGFSPRWSSCRRSSSIWDGRDEAAAFARQLIAPIILGA